VRAEGFARILEGRRLARALDLALAVRPVGEPAGGNGKRVELVLEARHGLEQTLGVRSLPAMLTLLEVGVDARGLEQRQARSLAVEELERLDLPPGRVTRVPLGEFALDPGSALALRATFELDVPAGELYLDGRPFPANGLRVRPCNAVRLAAFLPSGAVEPSELVRCLLEGCSTPALIERAVRIAPERRDEALELLAQSAPALTRQEVERAVPALRWISGERELGLDAEAWRRWLAARASGPRGTGELPESRDSPAPAADALAGQAGER
jgi:hypothetical protein